MGILVPVQMQAVPHACFMAKKKTPTDRREKTERERARERERERERDREIYIEREEAGAGALYSAQCATGLSLAEWMVDMHWHGSNVRAFLQNQFDTKQYYGWKTCRAI
jgi:hypothetical protein